MREVWQEFSAQLADLAEVIEAVEGLSDHDRAEGYRYITRLLRLALEMQLEHGSAQHPSFYSLSHDTAKIGADNPDNLYLNANIDGRFDYEISGHVGTVPYLSFGTKENRYAIDGRMISTGEVDLRDLDVGADGHVSLMVSAERQSGNWLPVTERSNMVIVRQTFNHRQSETPARLTIRRLDTQSGYDMLGTADLGAQLERSIAFVRGTAQIFRSWVEGFETRHFNRFELGDQSFFQAAGGDPNICYIYAFWRIAEDEAMRVDSQVPTCDLWNFQLTNIWMESFDYRHHPVHTNNAGAALNGDGTVTIHVTHEPIDGLTNNLVTTSHLQGVMLMRWIGAETHPLPELSIVKTSELLP